MKLSEITRRDFLKGAVGAVALAALPAKAQEAWDQLRKGMTRDEVYSLLGEPLSIRTNGDLTLIRYKRGFVRVWKGKVTDWSGSQKMERHLS